MMHSIISNPLVLGLIGSLALPASAYWRMSCPSRLVQQRADPIISPGHVSAHVHVIAGGNGFGFNETYAQARGSQCSSCEIKQDLSNYWTPMLYYQAQNGSFTRVPLAGDGNGATGGKTVYYEQRPAPANETLVAFPKDFRMVAGNPFKRNNTNDVPAQAITFACLNYDGPATAQTNSLPMHNCPQGVRVQVYFPSCWDGKNLDSPDHQSHMAYPIQASDNGYCPPGFPVHFISIFYELIYQTNNFADQWYGSGQPFVFAQGDPTGYGFHGDFVNGWDVPTLQNAINHCNASDGATKECPYFNFYTPDENVACNIPSILTEDINGPLAELPGCNPVQPGPGMAINHAPTCTKKPVINTAPTYFTDVTKSKKWAYVGCGNDTVNGRTFTGASGSNSTETVEQCIDFCSAQGFIYAGLEYSTQCFCDNSLPADRAPLKNIMGNCIMPCGGNSTQMCGGGNALSIYKKCTGSASSCKNAVYVPLGPAPVV